MKRALVLAAGVENAYAQGRRALARHELEATLGTANGGETPVEAGAA